MLESSLLVLFERLERIITMGSADDCPAVMAELEKLKGVAMQKLLTVLVEQKPTSSPNEALLDLQQVANVLNLPLSRARELSRRSDGFPIKRIGRHIRVKPSDLWEWIDKIQQKGLAKELDHRYSNRCHDRRRNQTNSETPETHST